MLTHAKGWGQDAQNWRGYYLNPIPTGLSKDIAGCFYSSDSSVSPVLFAMTNMVTTIAAIIGNWEINTEPIRCII